MLAEPVATASVTAEFVDRWRAPGDGRSKVWDDKFAEVTDGRLGVQAWNDAPEGGRAHGRRGEDRRRVGTDGADCFDGAGQARRRRARRPVGLDRYHGCRPARSATRPSARAFGARRSRGACQPGRWCRRGRVPLHRRAGIVHACPGSLRAGRRRRTTAHGKLLGWRGTLAVEPPRRPEPPRVSATAAARSEDWKFGFVGSRDPETGAVHLPPSRVDPHRQHGPDVGSAIGPERREPVRPSVVEVCVRLGPRQRRRGVFCDQFGGLGFHRSHLAFCLHQRGLRPAERVASARRRRSRRSRRRTQIRR